MLLDFPALIQEHCITPKAMVHCGAHFAEEAPVYRQLGIDEVYWIEGNPDLENRLRLTLDEYPKNVLITALLDSEERKDVPFHVTNYDSMSSSLLTFGTHPTFSPDTVFEKTKFLPTRTLDSLATEHDWSRVNILHMDLQGVEGRVLQGAKKLLVQLDAVMSEINKAEVYVGCSKVWELDEILYDFVRVGTHWVGEQGWGDGLWIRR